MYDRFGPYDRKSRRAQLSIRYGDRNDDRSIGGLGACSTQTDRCGESSEAFSAAVLHAFSQYSIAVLDREKLDEESCQNCFNQLKRKENAVVLSHGTFVGKKSIGPTQAIKQNENNMLEARFSVAPMMDWTGTSQKAKYNQRLGAIVGRHAVPNAVPIWF
jgi:hypothetical protein